MGGLMPIANYSTSISALKSVGEIQGILVGHGATSIMINYSKDKTIESLSFIVETPHGHLPFRLPVDTVAVQRVLEGQGVDPRYRTSEHASRVAWRILKDWVRAQMALLETEMVRIEQVFLPYMMSSDKKTLYETMRDKGFYLQEGKG